MKNDFGQFNEGLVELAHEMWEYRTCQRSDGSYYGTGGQCRKGTESTLPEKKTKSKKPVDSGSMGKMSDSQLKQLAGRKELDTAQKAAISKELQDRKNASLNAGNLAGNDPRSKQAAEEIAQGKQDAADAKTLSNVQKNLLKNNGVISEMEGGYGAFDGKAPRYLTEKQDAASERLMYKEKHPNSVVSELNDRAIVNAAKNYKGGKQGLADDIMKGLYRQKNWDGDEVSPKVGNAAEERVTKATRTEFQKLVKKEFGITVPNNVRSPAEFISSDTGMWNDKYTGFEIAGIILSGE